MADTLTLDQILYGNPNNYGNAFNAVGEGGKVLGTGYGGFNTRGEYDRAQRAFHDRYLAQTAYQQAHKLPGGNDSPLGAVQLTDAQNALPSVFQQLLSRYNASYAKRNPTSGLLGQPPNTPPGVPPKVGVPPATGGVPPKDGSGDGGYPYEPVTTAGNPSTTDPGGVQNAAMMFPQRPASFNGVPYLNSFGGANKYRSLDEQIASSMREPMYYGAQFGRWQFPGASVTAPATAPLTWGKPPRGNYG